MIPTRIGQVLGGGTFTGFNRICNQVYAIVVAPKCTETVLQIKTSDTATFGTQSTVDGLANTLAMNDNEHPAAHYCINLTVNGFSNWYLPSKNELALCYRFLKPSTEKNYTYDPRKRNRNVGTYDGIAPSSIPRGMPHTETTPSRTVITNYITDSTDSFAVRWYWSSTESSVKPSGSLTQFFPNGDQSWCRKYHLYKVRAV